MNQVSLLICCLLSFIVDWLNSVEQRRGVNRKLGGDVWLMCSDPAFIACPSALRACRSVLINGWKLRSSAVCSGDNFKKTTAIQVNQFCRFQWPDRPPRARRSITHKLSQRWVPVKFNLFRE